MNGGLATGVRGQRAAPTNAPSSDLSAPPRERESDVTSKRLLRNTAANGLGFIGNALITVAITPFLLHNLGVEQYGLWVLALSLTFSTGYLALADLGLAEASVKFIAEARAAGSPETINAIVSSTLAVFAVIGVLAGGLIAAAVPLLVRIFGVDDQLVHTAQLAFLLMGFEVVLELPVAALRSVIAGVQSYGWLRAIDLGSKLLWGASAVVAVRDGHGIVALAALTLAATIVRALATLVVAHRLQPGLQIRRRHVDRRTIKKTMGYGSFVGGLQLLSVIYSQMDRVIIAVVVSVAAVARYEVAFRIQSLAVLALTVGSSAVLPAAAYNAVRADAEKQRQLYIRGSRYSIAISLSVTLGALMFARWIIEAWVGADYTDVANASRLFLVFPILACANQVGVTMLVGLGRAKRVLLYQTIAVLTNLVVSVLLAPRYGISGVVVGTLVGGLVTWIPYLLLLLRTFEVSLANWFARIVAPSLPGVVAQIAFGLCTLRLLEQPHNLPMTLAFFAASIGVNLIVFFLVGTPADERRHLAQRFLGRSQPRAVA